MEAEFPGYSLGNAGVGGLSDHCITEKYENHDPAPRGGAGKSWVLGPAYGLGVGIESWS